MVRDGGDQSPISAHVYLAQPDWIKPQLRPLRAYIDNLLGGADLLSAGYVELARAFMPRLTIARIQAASGGAARV